MTKQKISLKRVTLGVLVGTMMLGSFGGVTHAIQTNLFSDMVAWLVSSEDCYDESGNYICSDSQTCSEQGGSYCDPYDYICEGTRPDSSDYGDYCCVGSCVEDITFCITTDLGVDVYEYETAYWASGAWDQYGENCAIIESYMPGSNGVFCAYDGNGNSIYDLQSGCFYGSGGEQYVKTFNANCDGYTTSDDADDIAEVCGSTGDDENPWDACGDDQYWDYDTESCEDADEDDCGYNSDYDSSYCGTNCSWSSDHCECDEGYCPSPPASSGHECEWIDGWGCWCSWDCTNPWEAGYYYYDEECGDGYYWDSYYETCMSDDSHGSSDDECDGCDTCVIYDTYYYCDGEYISYDDDDDSGYHDAADDDYSGG